MNRCLELDQKIIFKDIRQLVTLSSFAHNPARGHLERGDLGIYEPGFLVISGETILSAGSMAEYDATLEPGSSVIDCGGYVITPGFIDTHTHALFAGWRAGEFEMRLEGASYEEILAAGGGIHSTVRETRAAGNEQLLNIGLGFLEEMQKAGTTTAEIKSGYGLSYEQELRHLSIINQLDELHPVEVVATCLAAHTFPLEFSGNKEGYVSLLTDQLIPHVASARLAEYCDVFCGTGGFNLEQSRRVLQYAKDCGLGLRVHADEFADEGGTGLALQMGADSADHLLNIGIPAIEMLAESWQGGKQGTMATLLPGTAFYLGTPTYAPARELVQRQVPVALASDFNPGSSNILDLRFIMALACLKMGLSAAEALAAVTVNAAHSIGRAHRLGSLSPGKQADLLCWKAPDFVHLAYRIGGDLLARVYKKGRCICKAG